MNNPKFRAWANNRMMDVMIMEGKPYIYWHEFGDCQISYQEVYCKPMMYLEKRDSKGIQICEGDILDIWNGYEGDYAVGGSGYYATVVWNDEDCMFELMKSDGKTESIEELGSDYVTIIGNTCKDPNWAMKPYGEVNNEAIQFKVYSVQYTAKGLFAGAKNIICEMPDDLVERWKTGNPDEEVYEKLKHQLRKYIGDIPNVGINSIQQLRAGWI